MTRSTRAMIAAAAMVALAAGEAHAQHRRDVPAMIYTAAMGPVENRSSVEQDGANNGAITQSGNNNAACLIQIGRNLDGSITQTGDYNNTGVIQTRRGATEIPAELCSARRGNGRGVFMGIARHVVQRANR